MLRLLLGLVKGAAIGFGAYSAGMGGGLHWLTYGLVGACVGLLMGRPVWSHLLDKDSTVVAAVLKAIVGYGYGYGYGVGVYALVAKAWGGFDLTISDESRAIFDWQYVFGALVGGLYGAWVELDDAPDADKSGK